MMKRRANVLSLLVALLMVFAMMPMSAGTIYAAEEKEITCEGFRYRVNPDNGTAVILGRAEGNVDKEITIPRSIQYDSVTYNVTKICDYAFLEDELMTRLTVSEGIMEIGTGAFEGNVNLESIDLPDTLETIKDSSFDGCSKVETIELPDTLNWIGYNAFWGTAYYEKDENWKDGALYIGKYLIKARYFVSGEYTVDDGTRIIAARAFQSCTMITKVSIPASLVTIGDNAFEHCEKLSSVAFAEDSNLKIIDGYAFFHCISLDSFAIPASVIEIGSKAFKETRLKSITLPEGLNKIAAYLFENCSDLEDVTIPSKVTTIEDSAFYKCNKLSTIHFGGTQSDWAAITGNGKPSDVAVFYVGTNIAIKAGEVYVTLSKNKAEVDENVTVNCNTHAGYEYDEVKVTDLNGSPLKDIDFTGMPTDGSYTFNFNMPDTEAIVSVSTKVKICKVTFVDEHGRTIMTEEVEYGRDATAPENPEREGYTFTGWDKDFRNITKDLTVEAKWKAKSYTVTFVDGQGKTLKTEEVEYGRDATAPAVPEREGYTFTGWDKAFSNITKDLTVTALLEKKADLVPISIKDAKVVLSNAAFSYNGKVQKPAIGTIGGKTLTAGTDYAAAWSNASSKNAGSYAVTITGKGRYSGSTKAVYTINKASNTLKVKAGTAKVSYGKLKNATRKLAVRKVITFKNKGEGTKTYKKVKGNKKVTINKKTGKVTLQKGLMKGTYKVKVAVKAGGNKNYKTSKWKTVTFKIIVK